MWSIHEMRRIVNSMQSALNNHLNIESMIRKIENVVNDLREYNYNNQCSSSIPCKYWRAGCCIFGDSCRYKHFKISKFPLNCPYGNKCRRMINGKCDCTQIIRTKFNYGSAFKSRIRTLNGNNNLILNSNKNNINNNQDNFNLNDITVENNGINKKTIPPVKSDKINKLKVSKNINIVPATDKTMCSSLHNKHNNNSNKNNRISNNNNIINNNELVNVNNTKNDSNKLDSSSNLNFGISSKKEKDRIIGNCVPYSIANGNSTMISNLQMIENERLDGSAAASANNNNNINKDISIITMINNMKNTQKYQI